MQMYPKGQNSTLTKLETPVNLIETNKWNRPQYTGKMDNLLYGFLAL